MRFEAAILHSRLAVRKRFAHSPVAAAGKRPDTGKTIGRPKLLNFGTGD